MRILYISSANIWGGGSVALFNIIKGMMGSGHQVMVVTSDLDGPLLSKLKEIACPFVQMRIVFSLFPRRLNPYWFLREIAANFYHGYKTKKKLKELILNFKPDIVHTNVGVVSIAADLCYKMKIPHVWHIREYQNLDFDMKFFPSYSSFQRKIHRRGNFNIAITKGIFSYHRLRRDIDKVIYDGVFSEVLQDVKNNVEKRKNILFAGRVQEGKGTLEAIMAFGKFCQTNDNYKLVIAGVYDKESRYYKQCMSYINSNSLTGKVDFLGDRRDIYDLMSRSQMILVPSRFEGFGFITAEAMANNCLVLGRNTGGTKEQFDNGLSLTGEEIAYRFSSTEEMTEAITKAVDSDNKHKIELAKKVVFSLYTTEKFIRNLEFYYKEIISKHKN